VSSFGPSGKDRVEGPRTRACKDEWRPGKQEDDIWSVIVGIVVEADCEEKRQRKKHAASRSNATEKTKQCAETDGQLTERDDQCYGNRGVKRRIQEMVEGTRKNRSAQLLLKGSWSCGVEEVTIGQLLQSGKGKSDA
jgi:hypothetical protein